MTTDTGIPVLSFPSILRNPGLTSRYAHLQGTLAAGAPNSHPGQTVVKKYRRAQNDGKRWVRRRDNARFAGNPHIVTAAKRDYAIPYPNVVPTFPEPLPTYLPRNVKLPTVPTLPETDPASANAGRFSLSLKGMRRDLRRAGGRAEALVRDVESEMVQWLATGGTVLAPDSGNQAELQAQGTPIGNTETISEVSRTPLQLIWRISDDAFARYIVHCCARYHEVVSFSKGISDNRLTYLLRPNVTRPDRRVPAGLDTPPITDIDYSTNPDTDIDSEFVSERELESDSDFESDMPRPNDEGPTATSGTMPLKPIQEDSSWTVIEDEEEDAADGEFESGSEFESGLGASLDALEPRLEALSLSSPPPAPSSESQPAQDQDRTTTQVRAQYLHGSPRRRDWTASARSASSPSRSPARRRTTRRRQDAKRMISGVHSGKTFYEYLFM